MVIPTPGPLHWAPPACEVIYMDFSKGAAKFPRGFSMLHGPFKEGITTECNLGSLAAGRTSFCELNPKPLFRSIFIDCTQRLCLGYSKFLVSKPL